MTHLKEIFEFLNQCVVVGSITPFTRNTRYSALQRFLSVLTEDEEDKKTVEYFDGNLEMLAFRFSNLNPRVLGVTVDAYERHIRTTLKMFTSFSRLRRLCPLTEDST